MGARTLPRQRLHIFVAIRAAFGWPFLLCIAGKRARYDYRAMSNIRSKITLYNAALLRTGNNAVVEGDGSFIWQALEANYSEIVRAAFEDQEFTFGKARETLTSRAEGRFGYDDAYTMPSEVIHVIDVFLDEVSAARLGESWEIDSSTNEVMIDAGTRTVEVEFIRVGLEHTWSAQFAKGIQRRLEAVIKDAIDETSEAEALDMDADYKFLKAGVKSSKNRSKERVRRGGRLVRAHRGVR